MNYYIIQYGSNENLPEIVTDKKMDEIYTNANKFDGFTGVRILKVFSNFAELNEQEMQDLLTEVIENRVKLREIL